jgi:hypothetical protein
LKYSAGEAEAHAQFPHQAIPNTKFPSFDTLVNMPKVVDCEGEASRRSSEHRLLCALRKFGLGGFAFFVLWRLPSSTLCSALHGRSEMASFRHRCL